MIGLGKKIPREPPNKVESSGMDEDEIQIDILTIDKQFGSDLGGDDDDEPKDMLYFIPVLPEPDIIQ